MIMTGFLSKLIRCDTHVSSANQELVAADQWRVRALVIHLTITLSEMTCCL